MPTTVTAVVVSRGADVERILDALAAQTRRPEHVVVAGRPAAAAAGSWPATALRAVAVPPHASFGQAVARAVPPADPPQSPAAGDSFYWLLDQDTIPEPGALEALMAAMEASPSVGAAGPKLVDADDAQRLRGLGETLTSLGASVALVTGGPAGGGDFGAGGDYAAGELDQGQYDHNSDVLGVGARGMLVRAGVWDRVGGFDPALAAVDDGLDVSIRARLAGYRIVVVPAARVAVTAAGRKRAWHRSRQRHRRHRQRRQAQLHRRLVYAPAVLVPLHLLVLLPLALARSIVWLVRKRPGFIVPELAAALTVFVSWRAAWRARRRLRRERIVGFGAIAPLRLRPAQTRRMRATAREAARSRGSGAETVLFSEAGFWAVVAAAVAGVIVCLPILGQRTLAGGALLPLGSFRALWANAAQTPDPYPLVAAVLGSITFWHPSLAIAALWVAALPLAALGGWFAATALTCRAGLRAAAALAWAGMPPLLSALYDGRSGAVLFHLLVPWIIVAAVRVPRSWAATGSAAILSAAALACAPSMWLVFAAAWLVGLAFAGRRIARVATVPVPALALFAPAAVRAWPDVARLAADPGAPLPAAPASAWQVLAGLPGAAAGRLQEAAQAAASVFAPVHGVWPAVAVTLALFALPALLALAAAFLPHAGRAGLWIALALGCAAVAVTAGHVHWDTLGPRPVGLDAGPALSGYWFGILAAAVTGLDVMARSGSVRRLRRHPASRNRTAAPAVGILTWAAVAAVAAASLPVAAALAAGQGSVAAAARSALPAVVTAQAATDPQVGTLLLAAQPDGGVGATLVRGSGPKLESAGPGRPDPSLASLVGGLVSRGQDGTAEQLAHRGIGFVLVSPAPGRAGAAVPAPLEQAQERILSALQAAPALQQVTTGKTTHLYTVRGSAARGHADPAQPAAHPAVLAGLAGVFGFFLLLALPTAPPGPQVHAGRRSGRASGRRRAAGDGTAQAPGAGPAEAQVSEAQISGTPAFAAPASETESSGAPSSGAPAFAAPGARAGEGDDDAR